MIGRISFEDLGRFRVEGRKEAIYGLPCYQVALSEKGKLFPLRLRRGGQLFQGEQIRRLICPPQFPHWPALQAMGLRPYDPLPSLQRLGDRLLQEKLTKEGINPATATIALVGERVTPSFQALALSLCPWVGQLVIQAPQGGKALEALLYRHYGIAPLAFQPKAQPTISFSKRPEDLPPPFLDLESKDSLDFARLQLKGEGIPEDIPLLDFMGLLLQTGKINKEAIEIT